jgi:hypothetical protein
MEAAACLRAGGVVLRRDTACPKGNGGRHCCQPPLRRAKDMPVFGLPWSRPVNGLRPRFSILAHQLRRRFLPNSSLLRGARPIYSTARPEGSLVVRPFRPVFWNRSSSKPKPPDVPRPFLGRPLSRPASLTDNPKITRSRVALEEDRLFRRLFPAGPSRTRRLFPFLPAEIGPLVTCRALLAVAGCLGEAGTAVPIT